MSELKTKTRYSFDILAQDNTMLKLNKGYIVAYGYIGYEEPKTFNFNPTAATQYHFIYGEIDRSVIPNTFELKVKNNQGGKDIKPTTFRQDVLSTVKTGVFQLPLYRVKLGSNGIEEITDLRYDLNGINQMKGYIKRVYYAEETNKITKDIGYGVLAITPPTDDSSDKVATTLFTHLAIRNYIDNH